MRDDANMENTQTELDAAIAAKGGVTALAVALGVGQSVVSNWRMRGSVPAEQCAAIEAATGSRVEALRPDLDWQRDAAGVVTGYLVPVGAGRAA